MGKLADIIKSRKLMKVMHAKRHLWSSWSYKGRQVGAFMILVSQSYPVSDWNHWRQTCDGYFPNSLRPISYLGYIWDIYVLGLKTKVFFVGKTTKSIFPWTREPQWQNSAENTLNVLELSAQFVCPSPKVWISLKKDFIGCP